MAILAFAIRTEELFALIQISDSDGLFSATNPLFVERFRRNHERSFRSAQGGGFPGLLENRQMKQADGFLGCHNISEVDFWPQRLIHGGCAPARLCQEVQVFKCALHFIRRWPDYIRAAPAHGSD